MSPKCNFFYVSENVQKPIWAHCTTLLPTFLTVFHPAFLGSGGSFGLGFEMADMLVLLFYTWPGCYIWGKN